MNNKTLVIKSPSSIDADLLKVDELQMTFDLASGYKTNFYLLKGSKALDITLLEGNIGVVNNGTNLYSLKNETSTRQIGKISIRSVENIANLDFTPTSDCSIIAMNSVLGEGLNVAELIPNLTSIQLNGTSVSGDIGKLSMFPNLTSISLAGTSVTGDIGKLSACTELTFIDLSSTSVTGDIGKLSACTELTFINLGGTSVSGDIGKLSAKLTYLQANYTHIGGDINAAGFLLTDWSELGGTQVTGDLSKQYKLNSISAPSANMSWSSSTARSSKTKIPLFVSNSVVPKGLQLGNDLDNFLLDEAACTNVSGNTLTPKKIVATGTHTSVSDAAITTLQNAGITVTIYES